MMNDQIRIKLNEEQTKRFLSFFVDDAIRIANERKQEQIKKMKGEDRNEKRI
jgi:hypothetical protein